MLMRQRIVFLANGRLGRLALGERLGVLGDGGSHRAAPLCPRGDAGLWRDLGLIKVDVEDAFFLAHVLSSNVSHAVIK